MNKALEEMTDRELLLELVRGQRREAKLRYVKWGIAAVLVIAAAVLLALYIPKVNVTLSNLDNVAAMVETEIDNIKGPIENAMEQLEEFKSLGETLGNFDIEGFNNVITKLENLTNKVPWLFN